MNLENEIVAAGADKAPRLTPDLIQSKVIECHYINAGNAISNNWPEGTVTHGSLGLLTICVLVLENGFVVTGESACASPENYNEEIGRKIAHQNAEEKIWLLEGYLLKQGMHEAKHTREMLKDFIGGDCDGCKI